MSSAPDDPSIRTEHEAANLGNIIRQAGSAVVEETRKISQHDQESRAEMGAKYEAQKSSGSSEAGVYGDMAIEGIGGGLGSLLKIAKDTLTVADDRGWFSDKGPGASAAFPLTDRVKNVSKFFTGASDADDKEFPPKTTGMKGAQDIQVSYASRMLNQQKYEQALALQRQYEMGQGFGHQNRLHMGMAPTLGGMAPNLMMQPKAPSFKEIEEQPTNWGAGNVTG